MLKSQMKTMFITFFNIRGILFFAFISQCQAVNQAYYVEILKQLHEAMHRKGPELWPNDWILHQLTRHYLSSSFWPKN
jgi:hypothetical protein